jgi:hypothetical protein
MVFLVGARRSGTMWLQRALACHPDLLSVPSETYLFTHGVDPLTQLFQHGSPESIAVAKTYMDRDDLMDALRDFCDRVFIGLRDQLQPLATHVLERTPWHAKVLPLIGEIYPDAAVLHIIRDGRDVARSLVSRHWGPETYEEAADEWRTTVEAARNAGPALARYREVRYESLIADPEPQMRDIFAWLSLPPTEATLEAMRREMRTPVNLRPEDSTVAASKWESTLRDEDRRTVERVAGTLLVELGYATPDTMAAPEASPNVAKRLLRRARHQPSTRQATDGPAPATDGSGQGNQRVLDVLLECCAGRVVDTAGMFAPTAMVRSVKADETWQERGPEAVERVLAEMRDDGGRSARLIGADCFPLGVTVTAVINNEARDGGRMRRVLIAEFRDGAVTGLAYYRD